MNNALYALMVEKEQVLSNDVGGAKKFLRILDLKEGKNAYGRVVIYIDGYNDVVEELYEIPEVRKWVRRLINEVPHLWYYISRHNVPDIVWIMNCLSDNIHMLSRGDRKPINEYSFAEIRELPQILVHISVRRGLILQMTEGTMKHAQRIDDYGGGMETVDFINEFFNDREV